MEKYEMIYEGKSKQLFLTENKDFILIHYKDDATAFNGIKRAQIINKGIYNNAISSLLFDEISKAGIPTHFVEKRNERDQLCKKVDIIPLEIIVRNIVAGSMAKRLDVKEGTQIPNVVYELCLKNDRLGDPLINEHHAVALGLASYEELNHIYELTMKINSVLKKIFASVGITLIDFKIEYGKTRDGEIVLADEISPDSCRLWDSKTNNKLDKDRFRRDLGDVIAAYKEIYDRLENRKNENGRN